MTGTKPEDITWKNWHTTPKGVSIVVGIPVLILGCVFGGIKVINDMNAPPDRDGKVIEATQSPSQQPTPALQNSPPMSPSDEPSSSELGCLQYSGGDGRPSAYMNYSEHDFTLVDCFHPHNYELLARDTTTKCETVVRRLIGNTLGFRRGKIANFGPYSCALGRMNGDELQTDTYRITTNPDKLSAFGSCINPNEVELFLSGSLDYKRNVPCKDGKVLPAEWTLQDDESSEDSCQNAANQIDTYKVQFASDTADWNENGSPEPIARCAFTLRGVPLDD